MSEPRESERKMRREDTAIAGDAGEERATSEWVALETCAPGEMFYEAGGVYTHEPQASHGRIARPLDADEHVALCPRCGHRFAATEDGTAESHRDLHFDGDEDIPSICRNMPPRLRLVERG